MQTNNKVLKNYVALLLLLSLPAIYGCSTITVFQPEEIIKKPLGTESIKIGMTKDQIISLWGKPDHVTTVENKQKWSAPREVWTYTAHYGSIPVDAGYLSKTQKLYFDGDNLTEISD